jgi:hypothetical protein
MTIEALLERIAVAVERIADSEEYVEIPDAVTTPASPASAEVPAKPKRKRRTKAEMAAAAAAAPTLPAPPVLTVADPAGEGGFDFLAVPVPQTAGVNPTVFTRDNVRAALVDYQAKHGKDETFAFIKRFGGTNLNDLPEARYAELIAAAK